MRPLPSHVIDPKRGRSREDLSDLDDDPETVAARSMASKAGRLFQSHEHDDPTVQLSRMPVSFISESVMDPVTVHDPRPEAARWREDTLAREAGAGLRDEGTLDEVPPGPLPAPPPRSPILPPGLPPGALDRSGSPLARAVDGPGRIPSGNLPLPPPPPEEPWLDPRTAVLAPLLGGAIGGVVFILFLLALYAGSP